MKTAAITVLTDTATAIITRVAKSIVGYCFPLLKFESLIFIKRVLYLTKNFKFSLLGSIIALAILVYCLLASLVLFIIIIIIQLLINLLL